MDSGGTLLRLLPALSQVPTSPVEPRWRLLDSTALAAARKACSVPNSDPSQIFNSISVTKLRALLATELSAPLRPAAPHRMRLLHEIEEVIMFYYDKSIDKRQSVYQINISKYSSKMSNVKIPLVL